MTDQHTPLAALPTSFPPIANPPGWTKSSDLDLYIVARRPAGAPVLPTNTTMEKAYRHALGMIGSARTELATGVAVRANYNAGLLDPQLTSELMARPWPELVERLRAVDNALADAELDTSLAAAVKEYVNGQVDEGLFLNDEFIRLTDRHEWQPGSTSLCELNVLANRLGGLAGECAEDYWSNDAFGDLFDAVAAPLRGKGSWFLHTLPQSETCMRTQWRLADNNAEGPEK